MEWRRHKKPLSCRLMYTEKSNDVVESFVSQIVKIFCIFGRKVTFEIYGMQ